MVNKTTIRQTNRRRTNSNVSFNVFDVNLKWQVQKGSTYFKSALKIIRSSHTLRWKLFGVHAICLLAKLDTTSQKFNDQFKAWQMCARWHISFFFFLFYRNIKSTNILNSLAICVELNRSFIKNGRMIGARSELCSLLSDIKRYMIHIDAETECTSLNSTSLECLCFVFCIFYV